MAIIFGLIFIIPVIVAARAGIGAMLGLWSLVFGVALVLKLFGLDW
jgi:hypothetical protein